MVKALLLATCSKDGNQPSPVLRFTVLPFPVFPFSRFPVFPFLRQNGLTTTITTTTTRISAGISLNQRYHFELRRFSPRANTATSFQQ